MGGIRMTQRAETGQKQKTKMSQRMMHSMKYLLLPSQTLEENLMEEIMENPVLETDMEDDTVSGDDLRLDDAHDLDREDREDNNSDITDYDSADYDSADSDSADSDSADSEADLETIDDLLDTGEVLDNYTDSDSPDDYLAFGEIWNDGSDEIPTRSRDAQEQDAERYNDMMNNIAMPQESLHDHLMEQLLWYDLPTGVSNRAEEIIYNLNRAGYFSYTLEEIFGEKMTPEELRESEEALRLVQSFDPVGVGAKDLKECLLLQIKETATYSKEMRLLIEYHLDDIKNGQFSTISKETGWCLDQVNKVVDEIRQLNPQPGAIFDFTEAPVIRPDVYVEQLDDGNWFVQMADSRCDNLHLNRQYTKMLKERSLDKSTREYLRKNVASARWIIDMINQRKATIYAVAKAIVEHQKDFLEKGPEYIHPLILQQIADKIGVHSSTVSRACCNKWMQTPLGIFPFKRFFNTSVDGETTQEGVQYRIRELVEKENKKKPLSDEDIVHLLSKEGTNISRRAITKYRLNLNIPSSRDRRVK